jgi:hypothetical protein
MRFALLAVVAAAAISAGTAHAQVSTSNFYLRNTGDLVALCGVGRDDPNAAAAIHFCHGYYVGVDHSAEILGRPLRGILYCPPDGLKLSRDQVLAMVVDYHRKNPQYAAEAPIEGIIRWAAAAYPCKK